MQPRGYVAPGPPKLRRGRRLILHDGQGPILARAAQAVPVPAAVVPAVIEEAGFYQQHRQIGGGVGGEAEGFGQLGAGAARVLDEEHPQQAAQAAQAAPPPRVPDAQPLGRRRAEAGFHAGGVEAARVGWGWIIVGGDALGEGGQQGGRIGC